MSKLNMKKIVESVKETSVKEMKESISGSKDVRAENITEAFSEDKLAKVAQLLASLASKKLGAGQFIPFIGDVRIDEYETADGRKGIGFKFFSTKGNMIRFSFEQPETKSSKLAEKYLVNRVDYWILGKSKIDQPTYTVELEPWLNIVTVTDIIFNSLKTGTAPKIAESLEVNDDVMSIIEGLKIKLTEAKGANPILIEYAKYKGLSDEEIEGLGSVQLLNLLRRKKLFDKDEYAGFKLEKGGKEVNTTTKVLDKVEKALPKYADPQVIYKDIEKLTELVATNALKQNGVVICGAPGIGKCRLGSELINIKGI